MAVTRPPSVVVSFGTQTRLRCCNRFVPGGRHTTCPRCQTSYMMKKDGTYAVMAR